MKNPLILALDTSTGPCTVALACGADVLAYARLDEFQQQSKKLMSMVDEVVAKAKLKPHDIDVIATTLGPGSFTSLRVGLSVARGLALSLAKPFIGISTLEVIAYGAAESNYTRKPILPIINAYRGEVYAQPFTPDGAATDEPMALPPAVLALKFELDDYLIAGNAKAMNDPALKDAMFSDDATHPDAKWLAALALKAHLEGEETPSNPIYIRPPDAKLPANS